MNRLVLHRKIPEDAALQHQWNDLVLQMERPEVFYTCEWALAVQSAYADSLAPLLFMAYQNEELIGIVSLAKERSSGDVVFLAGSTGDYCDFLSHPSRRAELVTTVLSELVKMRMRRLTLANLPADSRTPEVLEAAAKMHGCYLFLRPAYLCALVDLGVGDRRQQLKQAVSQKKMLHRKLRALKRTGTVTYSHLGSWAQIQPALQGFAAAHVSRFKATQRKSSLATPERRDFLEDLAMRFGDSGIVTLSVLMVSDVAVAWNYGFRFCGSWFWYQPTFDGQWEEYSPGYCLLSRIVIEACDMEDMKLVDLGLGAEGYKERFANSTRQTLYVTVTKSWFRHVLEVTRYRAATLLKRSPKVESTVRRLLRR